MKNLTLILFLVSTINSIACDCNSSEDSLIVTFNRRSNIFKGKVLSYYKSNDFDNPKHPLLFRLIVKIEITEHLKGDTSKYIELELESSNCSPFLNLEDEYLFYPFERTGFKLWTLDKCSKPTRNSAETHAIEEIKKIRWLTEK